MARGASIFAVLTLGFYYIEKLINFIYFLFISVNEQ